MRTKFIGAKFYHFRLSNGCVKTTSDTIFSFTILDSRLSEFPRRTFPFLKNMDKRNKPFTVVIEGNIGSGKTTLLNYFSKYRDVEVLQEPVDKWRNVDGHNLLVNLLLKCACHFS